MNSMKWNRECYPGYWTWRRVLGWGILSVFGVVFLGGLAMLSSITAVFISLGIALIVMGVLSIGIGLILKD